VSPRGDGSHAGRRNNKKNSGSAPATPDATGQAPNGAAFASGGAGAPAAAPAAAAPAWHPTVLSRQGSTILNLVAEATEIVQTKSKATSLSALAADQVLDQALSLGTQAAQQALMKSGSAMGSSAVSSGTNILGGILGHRPKQAKVTYVWALTGGSSQPLRRQSATFEVNYAGIPGVNPTNSSR